MSTVDQLLTEVLQAIQGLDDCVGCTFKIRKRPYYDAETGDTLPLVIISPGEPDGQLFSWGSPQNVMMSYPIAITIYCSNGGDVENATDITNLTTVREAIRKTLWSPTFETPPYDVRYDAEPIYTMEGMNNHIDVSLQLFTFLYIETRS